jgi:hypothetical protein
LAFYTAHRHKLRFCKTILQIVLSAKTVCKTVLLQNSENADYDGGKNTVKRPCLKQTQIVFYKSAEIKNNPE